MTLLPMQALKTAACGLASLQQRAWLPPVLLLLALSSVFLFGGDHRGYFYRGVSHDTISSERMAMIENLSLDHNFLMFRGYSLDTDGKPAYKLYNRFPIGGYALIKLTNLPFADDMSAKIYAARMLMLLFFAAAAVLAYLSLRRLASNPWIALTATLLAFSSPFCLYYSDMISSEFIIDLFAILLVFHGMVIFEQEGRFLQLPIKACIALLLGWHVYAILLPFIAFGLMRELIKARSGVSPISRPLQRLKHTALSLLRSRYMALGVAALLFGVSVLTFNFTNEYLALNRETPLTELPSFKSMMNRTGAAPDIDKEKPGYLSWPAFTERQFYRIGAMSLPFLLSPPFVLENISTYNFSAPQIAKAPSRLFIIFGIAVSVASLIGLLYIRRHKILWATLALSGFCWALPMRHNTAFPLHNFEAIFYIGVALTLFSLALLWLYRLRGERIVAALSVVALLVFVASALRMAQPIFDAETFEVHKAMFADLEAVRDMTGSAGKVIWANTIPGEAFSPALYYLSGRIAIFNRAETVPSARPTDLVLTNMRLDGLASLTPRNQALFLYEWDDHRRHIDEITAQAGEPLIRSVFDAHLIGNKLMYVKDACRLDDTNALFFLALYPVNESDLPAERRQHGFDNLDFRFEDQAVRRGERCIAIMPLPRYDIERIYTGQYIQRADGSFEHLWEDEISLTEIAP